MFATVLMAGCQLKNYVLPNHPLLCKVVQGKGKRADVPKVCTQIYCNGAQASVLQTMPELSVELAGQDAATLLQSSLGSPQFVSGVCAACTELNNRDVGQMTFVCDPPPVGTESKPAPSRRTLAFSAEVDGRRDIYKVVAGALVPSANLTAGTNRINTHPDFSPDGKYIAFASGGHRNELSIMRMDIDGANKTPLLRQAPGSDMPRWSPNGARIGFRNPGGTQFGAVWVMDSSGQTPRKITSPQAGENDISFDFLTDDTIVFVRKGSSAATGGLFTQGLNGEAAVLVAADVKDGYVAVSRNGALVAVNRGLAPILFLSSQTWQPAPSPYSTWNLELVASGFDFGTEGALVASVNCALEETPPHAGTFNGSLCEEWPAVLP